MKQLRDSVGYIFKDYMKKLINESPVDGEKAGEIGFQLISLIVDASYNLSDEASATFHAAMGNCNVGKHKIAQKMNETRHLTGKKKKEANQVTSNLKYARQSIREYLDKEIVHINV